MKTSTTPYQTQIDDMGQFHLRPLDPSQDMALIHGWLSQPFAQFWGMQDMDTLELADFYRRMPEEDRGRGYLGFHDGVPCFLIECYNPVTDPVGEHYQVREGDYGMHILIAPPEHRIPGFTRATMTAVMRFLFEHQGAERVVVEPDERNDRIHTLNRFVGFTYERTIELPGKTAWLAFCTRNGFESTMAELLPFNTEPETRMRARPQVAAQALDVTTWASVNRDLVRKTLAELAHERLLAPEPLNSTEAEWTHYRLVTDEPGTEYRFHARIMNLNHWHIQADSIEKWVNGAATPLDSLALIIELKTTLGMGPEQLPTYLEEISSTLYAAAHKRHRPCLSAAELVDADFQTLEMAMAEGHPCFLANNGRIGFDTIDFRRYTPETGAPVQLIWLAAHRRHTDFACSDDLSEDTLLKEEIDPHTRARFEALLREQGLTPSDYHYLPVHPWQWFNKLTSLFAPDLARADLVCLGYGPDRYQAQQSIRTFFNRSQPRNHYVKTALSILNMGFMRGLSPYYMSTTPAINDFLANLIKQDPYLNGTGFCILREVAGVGYRQPHFEQALDAHSPYRKMLSALWRESPLPRVAAHEKPMTMAALLHEDANGKPLLPALIEASGLAPDEWLTRYLDVYMKPLLHCFYAHDLVFMPHGENLILVMDDHVPVRAIMKDIAEETAIMNEDLVLQERVQRLTVAVPEHLKSLSILTDLFDCFFRFMADILVTHTSLTEADFWRSVANCIHDYQNAHPHLADKFRRYDLFAPEFTLSCLNRLQLANNQQMIDLGDPSKNLQFAGTLSNPVTPFARSGAGGAEAGNREETADSITS